MWRLNGVVVVVVIGCVDVMVVLVIVATAVVVFCKILSSLLEGPNPGDEPTG